jgi:pimeloyl-ACP methyl ester carboxylesterase
LAGERADAMAEMFQVLGLRRAHLLGISYGCQIIAEFAARHPGLAGKLVMTGPTVDPAHRSVIGQAVRLATSAFYEDPSLSVFSLLEFRKAGWRVMLATLRHCLGHAIERTLPRVAAPVLVVRGSNDALVEQSWAEEVVRLLPCAELRVIAGGGHALNDSHPEELARVISPFLGYHPR